MNKVRNLFALALAWALALGCFFCLAEDWNETASWLKPYLNDGWMAESGSECGDAGAVLLKRDEQKLLVIRKGDLIIENAGVAKADRLSLLMDTENTLYLVCPGTSAEATYYCFSFEGERWLLRDIRYIGSYTWEDENGHADLQEYVLNVDAPEIRTHYLIEDRNENILWQENGPVYPNVLTEDERDLAQWNPWDSPVHYTGYRDPDLGGSSDSVRHRLFDTLKNGTFFREYEYVDGLIQKDELQFIADRPDGKRVLLCGIQREDSGWEFVESTSLPAGTTMGNENFTDNLWIPAMNGGPSVQRFADGTWGLSCMMTRDGGMYFMGQNWICESAPFMCDGQVCYGEHPWNDITAMDWDTLPLTLAEAQAGVDMSRWAMPNNGDPEDRLHLREKPDKGSRSLGKFYNGTPVEVLEKGSEWTRVKIGNITGYMMTKYLAFGKDMMRIQPYLSSKTTKNWMCHIAAQGNKGDTEEITLSEFYAYSVIGLTGDEWWIVWNANDNSFGMIHDSELWNGNG